MDMTIGKLAKAAGVGVETIRFYERKGIIKKPPRHGAFRIYSVEEASRIKFVKRAQELGFTLREVKELLDLQSEKKLIGNEVQRKAEEKISEIRVKISDLKKMQNSLTQLAKVCGEGQQAIRECRLFGCFEKGC